MQRLKEVPMPDKTVREQRLAMAQKETLRELSEESRNDTLEIMRTMRYSEKDAKALAKALSKKYSRNLEKTAGIADLKSDVGMDEEDQKDDDGDFASHDEESVEPAAKPGDKGKDKNKEDKHDSVDFEEDLEEDGDESDDSYDFDGDKDDFDAEAPNVDEKEFDLSPNEEVVLDLPGNGEIIIRYNPKGESEELGELGSEEEPMEDSMEDDMEDDMGGPGELEPVEESGAQMFGGMTPEDNFGGEEMSQEKLASRYVDQWSKIAEASDETSGPNNNVKPNPDRNLGDDTAHSGDGRGTASTKPFKTQNAVDGPVADHGKNRPNMRLQRDGGNTLKSDPGLQKFETPTKNADLLMQTESMTFSGEYGDLIKQSIESSSLDIPTEGGSDFPDFELPSQMPETTGERKTIVQVAEVLASLDDKDRKILAQILSEDSEDGAEDGAEEHLSEVEAAVSQVAKSLIAKGVARELFAENESAEIVMQKKASRTCDAYTNSRQEPVDDFSCKECGARVVLCTSAQEDNYCPACVAIVKEAQRIVEAELNTKDWGDEFCADERGEDPNGDGGFGTAGKKGRAPVDKNARDMELRNAEFEKEAANEVDYWKRAFAEERTKAARYAQAVKTSAKMYTAGMLEGNNADTAIDEHARELMEQGLDVHAMRYIEDQVVTIAAQRNQERGKMARAANAQHDGPGLMTSIAMRQPTEKQVDIVSELSNVFTRPRPEEWDEDGHKITRS